jgi:DNA-binding transcriptional ArsR family regulator
VQEYSEDIPEEIKAVLKALDDDIRLAVIVALMKHEKITFSELKKLFDINSSSLSYHLTLLQDGGLVRNILSKTEDGSYSYYAVTEITEPILSSLYENIIQIPKYITKTENRIQADETRVADTKFRSGSFVEITPRTRRSVKSTTYGKSTGLRYPASSNKASGA